MTQQRILIIKHGALGDITLATGAMEAIRAHHPGAELILLTTTPYVELAQKSGLFKDIWVDLRSHNLLEGLRLLKRIATAHFTHVYDLQNSHRTDTYFYLLKYVFRASFKWSGTAIGAAFRHNTPHRKTLHAVQRLHEQLQIAGIQDAPPPSLNFLPETDILKRFKIQAPFVVLVPGGSAHRPEKRWPMTSYKYLANRLLHDGYTVVIVGSRSEATLAAALTEELPGAVNLTNQTSLDDLVTLGRHAAAAIGNDTGPLHILSLAGAPVVVFFSRASNPNRCAPAGSRVKILHAPDLKDVAPETAYTTFSEFMS